MAPRFPFPLSTGLTGKFPLYDIGVQTIAQQVFVIFLVTKVTKCPFYQSDSQDADEALTDRQQTS